MQDQREENPYEEHLSGPDTTNGHPLRDGKNPVESATAARSPVMVSGHGLGTGVSYGQAGDPEAWQPGSLRVGDPRHWAQAYVLI